MKRAYNAAISITDATNLLLFFFILNYKLNMRITYKINNTTKCH